MIDLAQMVSAALTADIQHGYGDEVRRMGWSIASSPVAVPWRSEIQFCVHDAGDDQMSGLSDMATRSGRLAAHLGGHDIKIATGTRSADSNISFVRLDCLVLPERLDALEAPAP